MPKHLKEGNYYNNFYDLLTIQECLRNIESWSKSSLGKLGDKNADQFSDEERLKAFSFASNFSLYRTKGERYRRRASMIQGWVNRDSQRDELFQTAQEPRDIRCSNCCVSMRVMLKELYELSNEAARVLFFFECPECKKRKGYFDNGEKYKAKLNLCPKCNKKISVTYEEQGKMGIWSRQCASCDFVEVETDDFNKMQTERIEREKREEALLKKHRAEFCLSAVEGEEYIQSLMRFEMLGDLFKKAELRRSDPSYKKVASLKKWTVVELERTLSAKLEKKQYMRLSFDKPEIGKHVIIPFTAQDVDPLRKEKDSSYRIQKIIKKALENSNWRLMTDGVSYRLGYLSGRLKGYEREEDLVKIIKQERTNKRSREN